MNTAIDNTKICVFLDDVILHLYNITYNFMDISNEYDTFDEFLEYKINFIKNTYPDIISNITVCEVYKIAYKNEKCLMQDYIFDEYLTSILTNKLGMKLS